MAHLLKQLALLVSPTAGPATMFVPGVAQNLMERAESKAGRNPVEAAQLRGAALAFLSVVR